MPQGQVLDFLEYYRQRHPEEQVELTEEELEALFPEEPDAPKESR